MAFELHNITFKWCSLQFIYSNTWSPISGTAWDGLGSVIWLEEMLLGAGFEVSKTHAHFQLGLSASYLEIKM